VDDARQPVLAANRRLRPERAQHPVDANQRPNPCDAMPGVEQHDALLIMSYTTFRVRHKCTPGRPGRQERLHSVREPFLVADIFVKRLASGSDRYCGEVIRAASKS